MSPTLRPPEEVRLKRTAMSTRELRRAEVLGRVKGQALRLVDAAKMLELSYRQAKRLWRRYREEGAKGLQQRSAGRSSNRAKPEKFRRKVLQLIREKYSGTEPERFGPTPAAESAHDAVWAHVRAFGDSHYCSQFSASERAGGAQQRGTSRSPGEETAWPGDPELRSCE